MWEQVKHYASDHLSPIERVGWDILKIVILIIIARFSIKVFTRIVDRTILLNKNMEERRRNTLYSLFSNIIKYTIYFILLVTILPVFGVQIGALLAGAGVVGITIAFGAQSLIKDFFNGFFILMEDQFCVGDRVEINKIGGKIHSFGLRVTSIQVWTGEIVFIPNSQINQVINFSKNNSLAVIDINVGYNIEIEQAIETIRRVMEALKAEDSHIVGEINVLGVQTLGDANYTIRATAETAPLTHWSVERLARERIHNAFAHAETGLPEQETAFLADKPPEKQDVN